MVQQVASVKTESAASSLPFNFASSAFAASPDNHATFSAELLRQSQHQHVKEQPKQLAANTDATGNRDKQQAQARQTDSAESRQQYELKQQEKDRQYQTKERQQHNERTQQQIDKRQDAAQRKQDEQRKADEHNNLNESKKSDLEYTASNRPEDKPNNELNQYISENRPAYADKASSNTEQQTNTISQKSEKSALSDESLGKDNNGIETTELNHVNAKDIQGADENLSKQHADLVAVELLKADIENSDSANFDYIGFVTQLAEFNDDVVTDTTKLTINQESVTAEEQIDSSLENASKIFEDLLLNTNASESNKQVVLETEFATVSIDKEALQNILDAQHVKVDLNGQLSEEELTKVQNIINEMLTQLHEENAETTGSTKALDEELLSSLLIDDISIEQREANKDVAEEKVKETLALIKGVDGEQNVDTKLVDSKPDEINVDLEDNKLKLDNQVQTSNVATNNDVTKPSTNQNSDNKSVNSNSMQVLLELNDKQTQKALENVNARLQSVVSELNEPAKGNEFIAALQSGVKEFKQQLQQGKEPGLDLKALVSDALSQANIDVPSGKQAKIEGALNQFNAVLNLANSVNYSANLQQAQVLGITDLQYAKEMNQQQIDGTKLANATNQASAQANADKAVNIFKQEGQAQLAEKVRWMVNSRNQSAEIRLDPPDLGGVNIRINLNGDSAQVSFNVQSNAAKDALDQAMPRLREMLQDQGIELGQSHVKQDGGQQQQQQDAQNTSDQPSMFASAQSSESVEAQVQPNIVEQRITNGALGGVDYYA